MQLSDVWLSVIDLADQRGVRNLSQREGCWECSLEPWKLTLNGHDAETQDAGGRILPPLTVMVDRDGTMVGLVGVKDGYFTSANVERDLLDALHATLRSGEHCAAAPQAV